LEGITGGTDHHRGGEGEHTAEDTQRLRSHIEKHHPVCMESKPYPKVSIITKKENKQNFKRKEYLFFLLS